MIVQQGSRGVQQHEVDAAADALVAERLRPTIERVRAKIGRGSPNTVGPMLERWFSGLAPRLGVAPDSQSEGMPSAIRQSFEAVWATALQVARDQAQGEIAQDRTALQASRAELKLAQESLASERAAIGEREAELRRTLELTREQLADAISQASRLAQLVEQRDHELTLSRHAAADLAQERSADRRRHDEAIQQLTSERQALQERFAGNERRLLAEVDHARQSAVRAKREADAAQERLAAKLQETQASAGELSARLHALQMEAAAHRERMEGAKQRITHLEALVTPSANTPRTIRVRRKARTASASPGPSARKV